MSILVEVTYRYLFLVEGLQEDCLRTDEDSNSMHGLMVATLFHYSYSLGDGGLDDDLVLHLYAADLKASQSCILRVPGWKGHLVVHNLPCVMMD